MRKRSSTCVRKLSGLKQGKNASASPICFGKSSDMRPENASSLRNEAEGFEKFLLSQVFRYTTREGR